MKENYVAATLQMIESGADIESVLNGLSQTLASAGHEKLHSTILKIVLRTLSAQADASTPLVTLSTPEPDSAQVAQIKQVVAELSADNQDYQIKVDKTIIGGFAVEYNHKLIDMSYKTKLSNLYQAVTK